MSGSIDIFHPAWSSSYDAGCEYRGGVSYLINCYHVAFVTGCLSAVLYILDVNPIPDSIARLTWSTWSRIDLILALAAVTNSTLQGESDEAFKKHSSFVIPVSQPVESIDRRSL